MRVCVCVCVCVRKCLYDVCVHQHTCTQTCMHTLYNNISLSGVVVPSYQCQLSGSRQARGDHRRVSRVNRQHTLLLFLFLEEDGAHGRGRGSCPNEQWRKQMELVHTMRGRLEGALYSFQRKFHQAVHSTLNKLLCNYGTHLKVRVFVYILWEQVCLLLFCCRLSL